MHLTSLEFKNRLQEFIGEDVDKYYQSHYMLGFYVKKNSKSNSCNLPVLLCLISCASEKQNIILFLENYLPELSIDELNEQSMAGLSMLMIAVVRSQYDIVKILLELGADTNQCSIVNFYRNEPSIIPVTPLLFASYTCIRYKKTNVSIIELLLRYGADPNFKDGDGHNALINILFGVKSTHPVLYSTTPAYHNDYDGEPDGAVDDDSAEAAAILIKYNSDTNVLYKEKYSIMGQLYQNVRLIKMTNLVPRSENDKNIWLKTFLKKI